MTKIKREINITENIAIVIKSDSRIDMAQAHTEAKLISKIASVVDNVQGTVSEIKGDSNNKRGAYKKWTKEEEKEIIKIYRKNREKTNYLELSKKFGTEKNKIRDKIYLLKKGGKI